MIREVTFKIRSFNEAKPPKVLAIAKQKLISELNCNILLNELGSESENDASEFQYYCLFSLLITALHINVLCLIFRVGHTLKTGKLFQNLDR